MGETMVLRISSTNLLGQVIELPSEPEGLRPFLSALTGDRGFIL
jgi:hypothetical protein